MYPNIFGSYDEIKEESNEYKHKYFNAKILSLSPADTKRNKNNCCVDTAVYYLLYSAITGRTKMKEEKFTACLAAIPLISLKLNQADAQILHGDGIRAIKKYTNTEKLAKYKGYKPLQLIDPPYVGSEMQCDVGDFSKRHGESARDTSLRNTNFPREKINPSPSL
jgi:hypothetical protein